MAVRLYYFDTMDLKDLRHLSKLGYAIFYGRMS